MGFQQSMPSAPLNALIEKIWDWDMPQQTHHYERVLPLPGAALIINLHQDETRIYADDATRRCTRSAAAILGGPTLCSQIIDTAEQVKVMGVVFRPGGASAFTAENLSTISGRDIDLHDLFGASADRLRQRLLETPQSSTRLTLLEGWLRLRLRRASPDAAISHAITLLGRVPQVGRLRLIARTVGLSDRSLTLRFSRQVGMTPKHYARLMRFRAVIDHAQDRRRVDWSAVAADCGYCDQAHLGHEFRRFAGMTPTKFMAARGPYANHVPMD